LNPGTVDHISVHSKSSSPPQSIATLHQRPMFTVPVEVHQPPKVNQNLTNPSKNHPPIQPATSFMDPLLSPAVKTTQISALENGRYALSRLHDVHLLKTVRLFLAFLYDNPNLCHEGFTAAHCKALIGSKGLPTDTMSLRKLYIQYHVLFGNLSEEDISTELITFRNYIKSNRINNLQRNREATSKFYNNRYF